MSIQEQSAHCMTYSRAYKRRSTVLNIDLNMAPMSGSQFQEGTSADRDSQSGQQGKVVPCTIIDLDAVDDDVIVYSPSACVGAMNNSRRNHNQTDVVDLDSEDQLHRVPSHNSNKRRRVSANETIINLENYVNLEECSKKQPTPPPPKKPTFRCPICLGSLVEEMTTKCGHIFCRACIKSAITAQRKCPTCRRKITMKDTCRIYLPAAD